MKANVRNTIFTKLKKIYNRHKNITKNKNDIYYNIKINSNSQIWVQDCTTGIYLELQVKANNEDCFGENCINLNGWNYSTNNIADLITTIETLITELELTGIENFINKHKEDFI